MRADRAAKNSHINDADIEILLIIAFVRTVSIFIVIFEKYDEKVEIVGKKVKKQIWKNVPTFVRDNGLNKVYGGFRDFFGGKSEA